MLSEILEDREENSNLVKEVLDKIVLENHNKKSQDFNFFFKNCKDVVLSFGRLQPGYLYSNFSSIKTLYGCQSYIMRNTITECLKYIMQYLTKKMLTESNYQNNFDELFSLVTSRALDSHSSC